MNKKRSSRREMLRFGALGAASLALGPLVSACGSAATMPPAATSAPVATSTPVPTSVPTATVTPSPTITPTVTSTSISDVSFQNSRFLTTKDGRELWYLEAGKPDGIPVIVHCFDDGTRRLFDPWITDAGEKGIRLISFDRPGYGNSTPLPGRSVASAAEDVTALAEELGLERLMVWGIKPRRAARLSLCCLAA